MRTTKSFQRETTTSSGSLTLGRELGDAVKQYVRIKFEPVHQAPRWYWAIRLKPGRYVRVDREGEKYRVVGTDDEGDPIERMELLIGEPLVERAARMSRKYGWLEVRR